MAESEPLTEDEQAVANDLAWDMQTMTEQIFDDLNGSVPRSTIQEEPNEVASIYENVRVRNYVPILIHRAATIRLRARQMPNSMLER